MALQPQTPFPGCSQFTKHTVTLLESLTMNHWLAFKPKAKPHLHIAACPQLKVTPETAGSLMPWARCGHQPGMLVFVLTEHCGGEEGAPYTDVQDKLGVWRAREGCGNSTTAQVPWPSHLAFDALSSVFASQPPHPFEASSESSGFGTNTENTVPCTQTFGLLLRTRPQTGPQ